MTQPAIYQALIQSQKEYDQISALMKSQQEEIKQIREILEEFKPGIKREGENTLLSTRQILRELGMKHDDKAWREIRLILIEKFGMTRIGNSGLRITRRKLNDFIAEHFK